MKPDGIYRLVQELKRRRVFRGIVVYGASTLILFEAADNLCNAIGLEAVPVWFLWLLGIGFIGSLWFSWIYDFTPGGIKKTDPIQDQKVPIPPKEIRAYKTTTFVSVFIIVILLSYNIIDGAKSKKIKAMDKSIAVLPLYDDELSREQSRHFEFIGHEITSCLLKVKDYKVVPWEDCRKYKRRGKHYPEIGNDLSAAILVDWTPHESNFKKHLSVDLVSANDEDLLWSQNFEIKGNWSSEICRHSRKISKAIARELRIYLTPEEKSLIDKQSVSSQARMFGAFGTAMTRDTWEMIQTGTNTFNKKKNEYSDSLSFDRAINFFTEAIKADPTFAEAYANRAKARLWGISAGFYDFSVLDECEKDIRKASDLQPNLPEAHVSLGFYYYYGRNEHKLALTSFEKAIQLQPENSEFHFYLSIIHRALGNWGKVQTYSDRVYSSNPRNPLFLTNLGLSYLYLHDFTRSIICQDRAIEIMPQWYAPYINKIEALLATNNIPLARNVLRQAIKKTDKKYFRSLAILDLYEGNYMSALEHIKKAKILEFKDLEETMGDVYLLKAKIHKHVGNETEANEYYRMGIDFFHNLVTFNPEEYTAYAKLGIAYAGIGAHQQAIENGQIALGYIHQHETQRNSLFILYDLVQLFAITGDFDSAQTMMEKLLVKKSFYTLDYLKLDPDIQQLFDPPGV